MPACASTVGIVPTASSCFANCGVNAAGMCCTMSTGTGNERGRSRQSVTSAVGPPVETPIDERVDTAAAEAAGGEAAGGGAVPVEPGRPGVGIGLDAVGRMIDRSAAGVGSRHPASALILGISSSTTALRPSARLVADGLVA